MTGLKLGSAAIALAAFFTLPIHAAAPSLPPNAVGPETTLVIHADAGHFNPEALRTAAKAVLGNQAARADEELNKFKEKFDKADKAGIQAFTMVVSSKAAAAADAAPADAAAPAPANSDRVAVYFQLKPGADAKEVQSVVTADMSPTDREKAVFEQQGAFLAMHEKDQPLTTKPDAERARLYSDALGTIGEASVQIAIVPDAAMRDKILKGGDDAPKGLKEALPAVSKSKWITVSIHFGNAPSLTASVNAAEADDAKKLIDGINAGLAEMKQQAANPGANPGPAAMFAPLIAQLADALKPTGTGSQVNVSLKGESLSMIANIAMQFMGGPGGPPRQAPGNSPAPGAQ